MKAIGLLARKGGTGKTTCAIHMGVLAQAAGQRVIFFDLDPQRSLAAWWQSRATETPGLVETDAKRLIGLLKAAATEYDLAVIDTPPAVSFDTAQVAAAVDLVLIPLRPSILDIYAVESTAAVVRATKTPALLVLNACAAPRETSEAPTTIEARKALEGMVVPIAATSLAQRMDYARALNGGEAVNEFAPGSKAAGETERLWLEVQRKLFRMTKKPISLAASMAKKATAEIIPEPPATGKTVTMTLRLKPMAHDQLREMAFTARQPQHTLMLEALNLLFERHGKPPIA